MLKGLNLSKMVLRKVGVLSEAKLIAADRRRLAVHFNFWVLQFKIPGTVASSNLGHLQLLFGGERPSCD